MPSISPESGESVSVFAPISVGNVSVGFDSLGMAVTPIDGQLIGDIVRIRSSSDQESHLSCSGSYLKSLPEKKEENIVWQCLLAFNHKLLERNIELQSVDIHLEKNTPICSGTGSSACSVVAGLMALNEFYKCPLKQHELLELMGELEAQISGSLHYDNVAPCYLGGLQLMLEDHYEICQSIPTFDDCYWVISYPDIVVSTKSAREILPDSYSRQTMIQASRLLAGFIGASYRQDKAQAFSVLQDVIAEPYRVSLLKNYVETKKELLANGSLAVGISGSGPTVFAVCDNIENAEKAKQILDSMYQKSDQGFTSICKVDDKGARWI
jgi:homoserine kinase